MRLIILIVDFNLFKLYAIKSQFLYKEVEHEEVSLSYCPFF